MTRIPLIRTGLVVAGLLALTGLVRWTASVHDDSGSPLPAVADVPLPARTVQAGDVTVRITPVRLDETGAVFRLALDTYSGDLAVDVVEAARLVVGGFEWQGARWDGAGAGGHHRQGTLSFPPGGAAAGRAELVIAGLPGPVEASWRLGAD